MARAIVRAIAFSASIWALFAPLALPPGSAIAYDWAHPGEGPWTAQIVDRQTQQPLDGVVVVAVWNKRYGSVGGWAGGGYFASEEVVTGADGRFTIAPLKKLLLDPFAILKGPEFYIFKGGYGKWMFQGQEYWSKLDIDESARQLDDAWRRFNGDGVLIELPPLITTRDKQRAMNEAMPPVDVPRTSTPKMIEAINRERLSLGLDPLRSNPAPQK